MAELKALPWEGTVAPVVIEVAPQFSRVCSVTEVPFGGRVQVRYQPHRKLLEFESFERWLVENSLDLETVESFAVSVYSALLSLLDPAWLQVCVEADTPVHSRALVCVGGDDA